MTTHKSKPLLHIGKVTPLVLLMLPLTLLVIAPFWAIALGMDYLKVVRALNSDLRGDFKDDL